MKTITIVTACYNEEENIAEVYRQVKQVFAEKLPQYQYEHLFIDNASKDKTVEILRQIAAQDKQVKVIVNTRNFGHIRSPFHGLLQAKGDAVISLVADLQDPPSLIPELVSQWEKGPKMVLAVKAQSAETPLMWIIRKCFYEFISRLSDIELTKNHTGFGLYDQIVIQKLREIGDPYPYFRGLISDLGYDSVKLPYDQPVRKRGITKNNFYTLYDMAMLGITNHSKVPLRLATMTGFLMAFVSFLVALGYLVYKIIYWDRFTVGTAPVAIGLFFFASVQLFFIGIIGEYIGSIHTQVMNRPLVVEKERINC
ncbi:MAG: glycosyltransferase family 2 protein [Pseudomonadota bacterium]